MRYLVTSALPYVNNVPHLGNLAGSILPADVYARFRRLNGDEVIYICGTDEHGTPITVSALKEGLKPQELCDKYHQIQKDAFNGFNIRFDNFSRTSRKPHYQLTTHFFEKLLANGLIVEKIVKQPYDSKAKMFLPDRYVEGTCPHCGYSPARGDQCDGCGKVLDPEELKNPYSIITKEKPIFKETKHWFLKLPDFENKLKEWLESRDHWSPNVKNFALGWIKGGLKERAITRDLDWGVPVPLENAEGKVIYVWFDAPIGYISSTKEFFKGSEEQTDLWWKSPDTKLVHFLGKDNVPFHAIIWPSLLLGVNEDYILPNYIAGYEYLNFEGKKFSKSLNHGIWVDEALKLYPADYWRYALIALLPQTKDSDFSWEEFSRRVNDELNDIIGNFVHRSLTFLNAKFNGQVPEPKLGPAEEELLGDIRATFRDTRELFSNYDLKGALNAVLRLAKKGNQYFNEQAPWQSDNPTALYTSIQIDAALAILLSPFLPESAQKLWGLLAQEGRVEELKKWGPITIPEGTRLPSPKQLFSKLDPKEAAARLNKLRGKKESNNLVSFEEFKKVQLKVGQIKSVHNIEGADKLLKLSVDIGEEKPRQLVAGIAKFYKPADLLDRKIVVVANLAPAKLRGVESQGMLLASFTKDQSKVILLDPGQNMPVGADVS